MEQKFESLLDFNIPFDVNFFDQVVNAFYQANAPQDIQSVLVRFQKHPQSWTRVDTILQQSQSNHAKMIAIAILNECIQYRWKVLPDAQKEGIKKFLVSLIIRISSDAKTLQMQGIIVTKLNYGLVQILKHDWPHNWPNFVSELVSSSRQSESLCTNNMAILKLLSEEVFDYSQNKITSDKVVKMKETLNKEFTLIYQLCEFVLENSKSAVLIIVTLNTLQKFLHWIPVGYIFETKLIEYLTNKFFPVKAFQNDTLACLNEIVAIEVPDHPEYNPKLFLLYGSIISFTSKNLLTNSLDVAMAFEKGSSSVQKFICNIAVFISAFLKSHISLLEGTNDQSRGILLQSLQILLRVSLVDDNTVFKICLDYWHQFVSDLYRRFKQSKMSGNFGTSVPVLMLGDVDTSASKLTAQHQMYAPVLSSLRQVFISTMAKPEEIIIGEDDYGNIVRIKMRDTAVLAQYRVMRDVLIFLTNLDPIDTQSIMIVKLGKQVDSSEWSWNNLNKLCWAVGSITGSLDELQEKNFLIRVIRDLLNLCEMKRGKDNKAVVASNIMYVVGQYPRFLRMHWKFLKTVVNKLFEFMHEKHPGVQEMSCETFLKIAKKCKGKFVVTQQGEGRPYIQDILEGIPSLISDLERSEIQIFYEAVAVIVSSEHDAEAQQKLIFALMTMPNQAWSQVIAEANQNLNNLWQNNNAQTLSWVLAINIRVAQALGKSFTIQLSRIYLEMLHVYKLYSGFVSNEINTKGSQYAKAAHVVYMKNVKKAALKLVTQYVTQCSQNEQGTFLKQFLPKLLGPVLDDYKHCHADAREAEVLELCQEIVKKFGPSVLQEIGFMFQSTFECTLEMITKNFVDYPDHRVNFFNLLLAINQHAFQALTSLNAPQFQLIMDSIVWAFKHMNVVVADSGLTMLSELIKNMQTSEVASTFHKRYFISLLKDLLGVMTDTFHKPGFRLQSEILAKLFSIVDTGGISVPLWDASQGQFPNNHTFVQQFTCRLLSTAFPNVASDKIGKFVQGLFQLHSQIDDFKTNLRDFLINIKEFSATPNDGLFKEDQMRRDMQMRMLEQQRLANVPGMGYRINGNS